MWWVLHAHAGRLDDIESTLAAYRGCGDSPLAELCAAELPLLDRLAVGVALGHLAQYEPPGDSERAAVRLLLYRLMAKHTLFLLYQCRSLLFFNAAA